MRSGRYGRESGRRSRRNEVARSHAELDVL